jgi:polyvinyl alcohol dehydrogenase (cytochrome)
LFLIPSQAAGQPPVDADWAQYNYDNLGTRHNRAESSLSPDNVGRLVVKWRFPAEGSSETVGVVHATPVVVNGFVYFGTTKTDPSFVKLSPRGQLVWSYKITSVMTKENEDPYALHGIPTSDDVMNAALVTQSRVFFGTFGGQIICLDRFDGRELWTINTKRAPFPDAHGANTVMSSPIMADGKLIVAGGGFEHILGAVPGYPCCSGRGYVAALRPETGKVIWKYDVGPRPQRFDPPVELPYESGRVKRFTYGPSTSSVWSTPSYDSRTQTLYFGTDTHNSPRRPTTDDQRYYNKYSSAVIAISAKDGSEKWVRQLSRNDVWNYSLPTWDPRTGEYKDLSIGDTPKIYDTTIDGQHREVVGVGCKSGVYYVIDRASGEILAETPAYRGPPVAEMAADATSRVLALPSAIGGLQTGCAFDGQRVLTNGIDWPGLVGSSSRQGSGSAPSGGRVTAIHPNALAEFWRHERPSVPMEAVHRAGDPVGSGIAVANGVAYFTTTVSNCLVALRTDTGQVLFEHALGPVWCGPSVSRGRVYVGSGNALFDDWSIDRPADSTRTQYRFRFPVKTTGGVYCFGLPDRDAVDGLPDVESPPIQ